MNDNIFFFDCTIITATAIAIVIKKFKMKFGKLYGFIQSCFLENLLKYFSAFTFQQSKFFLFGRVFKNFKWIKEIQKQREEP